MDESDAHEHSYAPGARFRSVWMQVRGGSCPLIRIRNSGWKWTATSAWLFDMAAKYSQAHHQLELDTSARSAGANATSPDLLAASTSPSV
jgi:hypothetical protein